MSIFEELNAIFDNLNIPVQTAEFTDMPPPESYSVLTPVSDDFDFYAGDKPLVEINAVRITILTKHNYTAIVRKITNELLKNEFDITQRRYVSLDVETKYHQYAIDCEKYYNFEPED